MELEIIFRFPSRINCNAPQLWDANKGSSVQIKYHPYK